LKYPEKSAIGCLFEKVAGIIHFQELLFVFKTIQFTGTTIIPDTKAFFYSETT